MKLLLVLSLGCLLVHQASAACTKVIILMDAPPANPPNQANGCPSCRYIQLTQTSYNTINTLGLTMNDALVIIPSGTTTPSVASVVAGTTYLWNLAANTNLYLMTNSIPVGGTNANNLAIMNVGTTVPNAHIVDYYAYLNTNPLPLPAVANPCNFLASSPPTLSGKCAYPVSTRVVILTDDAAPYPQIATSCLGSCFYYPTSKYMTLSTLGLGMNDALVLMTTATSSITTTGVINFAAYITNLSLNTNVYYFTSPGAANAANNNMVMLVPSVYPRVIAKDYAAYTCPTMTANAPGNCACKYIATGFGG